MCGTDVFLCVLSLFFPPIGVWVKRGICSADSLINIALCVLGFLPGLLHSWYIILCYPEQPDGYERVGDAERQQQGRVTWYYISHQPGSRTATMQPPPGAAVGGYGTTAQPGPQTSSQQQQQQPYTDEPSSSSGGPPPPTYADAVKADNKVQK